MKKITAYGFILLANIVLLAHAVLPHHYHEQFVCIEQTHCSEDDDIHTNNSEHDHQHEDSNNTSCALKQAVFIPSTQARFENNYENRSDNHNFYIRFNFGYVNLQPNLSVITYGPDFLSFFTTFVTTTLGLRAPPIV